MGTNPLWSCIWSIINKQLFQEKFPKLSNDRFITWFNELLLNESSNFLNELFFVVFFLEVEFSIEIKIPYARHYNPLLIRNRSWILTIHKAWILRKKPLEKTFLDFKKWVKRIQTAGYNGARTVLCLALFSFFWVHKGGGMYLFFSENSSLMYG